MKPLLVPSFHYLSEKISLKIIIFSFHALLTGSYKHSLIGARSRSVVWAGDTIFLWITEEIHRDECGEKISFLLHNVDHVGLRQPSSYAMQDLQRANSNSNVGMIFHV